MKKSPNGSSKSRRHKPFQQKKSLSARDAGSRDSAAGRGQGSISTDDFHRLGVRPQECRLTVIRRAAARSSKVLAEQQLVRPSGKTERQLSQVAVSAYRLMDPRNRDDSHQRVYVGRIQSNTLLWAGRTRFAVGSESASEPNDTTTRYFESHSADVLDEDAALPISASNVTMLATGIDLGNDLTSKLTSDDILQRGWVARSWVRFKGSPLSTFLSVAAMVLAMVGLAGWASGWLESSDQSIANRSPVDVQAEAASFTSGPETEPQISGSNLPSDFTAPEQHARATTSEVDETKTLAVPATAMADSDLADNTVVETELATTSAEDIEVKLPAAEVASTMLEPVPPRGEVAGGPLPHLGMVESAAAKSNELANSVSKGSIPDVSAPAAEFLDDPFDTSPTDESELDERMDVVIRENSDTEKSEQTTPKESAIPEGQELKELRAPLYDLVPKLQNPINVVEVDEILSGLAEIESTLTIGSPDYWTVRLAMAEVAWSSRDEWEVADLLLTLVDEYGADLNDLLVQSFASSPAFVPSSDVHHRLVSNGFQLYDRLLCHEDFELAVTVSETLAPMVETLGYSNQQTLKQFDDAFNQMTQFNKTVAPILNAAPSEAGAPVSASESSMVGRYLCLLCRQWDRGLPWLAQGSDARMSGLAKRELAAAAMPPGENSAAIRDVAKLWLAAASRNDGRSANSMRLHGLKLLSVALAQSDGLKKLQLQRDVDREASTLPRHVKVGYEKHGKAAPDVVELNAEDAERPVSIGLTGRLRVDNRDTGVQFRYEPPMTITDVVLDQIRRKLNENWKRVTVHLEGEFELDHESIIRIAIAKEGGSAKQSITCDGKLVQLNADDPIGQLNLAAGRHKLKWIVTSEEFPGLFLDVRDLDTGRPVEIRGAYKRRPEDVGDVLSVDMVPSSR